MNVRGGEVEYEAIILVTRGDEMPKKNYEKKLHPTYETSIRIKNSETSPHIVVKFFHQYRNLYDDMTKEGVGERLKIPIDAVFPPSQKASVLGISMSEEALQQRCYLLNKWMNALFASYHLFPSTAQKILSAFLSLNDDDVKEERNKELILDLLQKRRSEPASRSAATNINTNINAQTANPVATSDSNTARTTSPAPLENRKSRGSILALNDGLSSSEIAQHSVETVFTRFLAVKVAAGEMIPKREGETRMHKSYETTLRIVPHDELSVKGEVDYESYRTHQATPHVRALKTFDSYAGLRNDLEELMVFDRDNAPSDAEKKNVVLDASFPKTYTKSSMGMHLTETQYQQRIALLNRWFGQLMRAYPSLPPLAQTKLRTWLNLPAAIPSYTQMEVFDRMLMNTFEPVTKVAAAAARESAHSGHKFGGMFGNGIKTTTQQAAVVVAPPPVAAAPPAPVVEEVRKETPAKTTPKDRAPSPSMNTPPVSAGTTTNNAKSSSDDGANFSRGGTTNRGSMGSVAGLGTGELEDLGRETTVNCFLAVAVSMGAMLPKKESDGKSHHSFETVIRILEIYEVVDCDKTELDAEAYGRYSAMQPKAINKVFDGYRSLKTSLQDVHVYSRDTQSEANRDPRAVVVDAPFPKTYPKSKLGIGLTDAQLQLRVTLLNGWMGKLMTLFDQMPEEAQELVVSFFSLEEDNPAEPQNRVIQNILRDTFVAPIKKPLVAQKGGKKASKNQQLTTSGKDSGDAAGDNSDDDEPGSSNFRPNRNNNAAQPPGSSKGCGCVIM